MTVGPAARPARLRAVLAAVVAVLFATPACKPDSARKADRAAEAVTNQRAQLERELDADKPVTTKAADVLEHAGRLAQADAEFRRQRDLRVDILRGRHSVYATQSLLIASMAESFPLTDDGRADVNEKLTTFHSILDETEDLIEGLHRADASTFPKLDEQATDAMKRLDDARSAAWDALEDAPKAARTAS